MENLWSVLKGWELELEPAGSWHYMFSGIPEQAEMLGAEAHRVGNSDAAERC